MAEDDKDLQRRQAMILTAIPMVLVAGPLVGFLIGNYLDGKFGTAPWLMIFFIIMGAGASIKQVKQLLAKTSGK
ncbi:MAG: AtpZ/AtpI family protein [Candidatus Manganitrophaceae bacterium]|nr:MAG: AtpZ/AtpI family protein [Candidatus Manganitrophaceae bacterium]